jgi:hypothetical protein
MSWGREHSLLWNEYMRFLNLKLTSRPSLITASWMYEASLPSPLLFMPWCLGTGTTLPSLLLLLIRYKYINRPVDKVQIYHALLHTGSSYLIAVSNRSTPPPPEDSLLHLCSTLARVIKQLVSPLQEGLSELQVSTWGAQWRHGGHR